MAVRGGDKFQKELQRMAGAVRSADYEVDVLREFRI